MKIFFKQSGISLAEMVMVVFMFTIFLMVMYLIFQIGLENWQIGAVKSEVQQNAEVAMKRIIKDLTYTNLYTLTVENSGQRVIFETPINNTTGVFSYDPNSGLSIWQGYILYYLIGSTDNYTLYRRYVARGVQNTFPMILLDAYTFCTNQGKVVTKNLSNINFEKSGSIVVVTIKYKKNIRKNATVMFKRQGSEVFELKSYVMPKN